jgi:segregation and condensation protein B
LGPAEQQDSSSRTERETNRRDPQTALVEAALFLAAEPLTARKLAQLAGLDDATLARTVVRRLNEHYERDGSAFRVEEIAGGFQLMTHPRFGGWLRRLHPAAAAARLSSPALETLAVVAYRQPVVRAEIESIRGVQGGEMLRQLMDRDLIRIVGKSQELGRPFLYGTTKRFLQVFGLGSLEDLPRADQLRARPHDTSPTLEPSAALSETTNSGAGRSDDSN